MRTLLSEHNFRRALVVSAIVTVMAVPRFGEAGMLDAATVAATFVAMAIVGGMATAWERYGGLSGLLPGRERIQRGLILAIVFAAIIMPILLRLDPQLAAAMAKTSLADRLPLAFPQTFFGCVALLLWDVGVETLFFYAAAMAFFARVTASREIAIGAAVVFRILVSYSHLGGILPDDIFALTLAIQLLTAFVTAMLLAYTGIVPAVLFTVLLNLRRFL